MEALTTVAPRSKHASKFRAPQITEQLFASRIIAQTFRVRVFCPMARADGSERFPVVYSTDADDFFPGLATQAQVLQTLGEAPRFVLVGVGYENAQAAPILRMRDLWTHENRRHYQTEMQHLIDSELVSGVDNLSQITAQTDATDFLRFLRDELMPFINERYPVTGEDCSYSGYSAGATFGLYTLFTRPETFKRYILGSPGTSYKGHNFGIEMAQQFIQSGKEMSAEVFLSVGDLEEFTRGFEQFDLVSGWILFMKHLMRAEIPGLALTARVFPGETHATAWTNAFNHGVKALLGAVDQVPFWPKYLK